MDIRVRIAPSPTGNFHIGTARTALFNWLFAKKNKGGFLLRIEDTDLERSNLKYEEDIIDNLKWLGLNWDGEIYRQSDRLDVYEKYIKILFEKDLIYHCFCSKEDLENERQAQLSQGLPPRYSGHCRRLDKQEIQKRLDEGKSSVLRLKVPITEISFKDIIRGETKFDTGLIGDMIIAKNPRTPLYNFAVVIDDAEAQISHVIRGEDHIANTPKQILIQQALDFPRPKYAHLPLILNPNRSKLSKRFAAVSISDYKKDGYLAEALFNFLALLGWHPQDDQEIFNKDELIEKFALERVQKGGAAFDINKLNWINSQYIRKLDDEELIIKLHLEPNEKNKKIMALVKERLNKLTDFNGLSDFFYQLPDYDARLLIWKDGAKESSLRYLQEIYNFNSEISEDKIKSMAEKKGRGEVLWPFRVALSGKDASPGPFEIMNILGKEETLRRVKIAIEKLKV